MPRSLDETAKAISKAEEIIEKALWASHGETDYHVELKSYCEAEAMLRAVRPRTKAQERECNRVLSYCFMRIDEVLVNLGEENDAVARAEEALLLARCSGNDVRIARCLLAYGVRLMNTGRLIEAETQWREIFATAEENDDRDMQQVLGWPSLARAHVLKAKSLENQALEVALEAEKVLRSIDNYAGLAPTYEILATQYGLKSDEDLRAYSIRKVEHFRKMATKEHR